MKPKKQETVVRRTWIQGRLVVLTALFVGGKCRDIDIKEYDARTMPREEIIRMVKGGEE